MRDLQASFSILHDSLNPDVNQSNRTHSLGPIAILMCPLISTRKICIHSSFISRADLCPPPAVRSLLCYPHPIHCLVSYGREPREPHRPIWHHVIATPSVSLLDLSLLPLPLTDGRRTQRQSPRSCRSSYQQDWYQEDPIDKSHWRC